METKAVFKIGQRVTLRPASPYYSDQCRGMIGKIAALPDEETPGWYEIDWANGSGNSYETHDIVNLETEWDQ